MKKVLNIIGIITIIASLYFGAGFFPLSFITLAIGLVIVINKSVTDSIEATENFKKDFEKAKSERYMNGKLKTKK